MGPNVFSGSEGALLEVRVTADESALLPALCVEWTRAVEYLLDELRWPGGEPQVRRDGAPAANVGIGAGELAAWCDARLFFEAPVDVLMTATDLSEQAWVLAERSVGSGGWTTPDDAVGERLRTAAATERASRPQLVALRRAAMQRDRTIAFDDELLSLGSGTGSRQWSLIDAPDAASVDWELVHDVPVALVTGSNGKTTTTRAVAAMWRAAGYVTGWCCSDGVWVGDSQLEGGDYSGPAGARQVLRDHRVQAAVLETARGGIMRRGLAVHRAKAAIITNIAADHFGEYGVHSLRDLALAKAVVAQAIGDDGRLVLNADDVTLRELAPELSVPLAWFSLHQDNALVKAHVLAGGSAGVVGDARLRLHHDGQWHELGAVADLPLTLGGAAPHNVANLLGASVLAAVLGIPVSAIRTTLHRFGAAAADNPGRLQLSHFGGVTVLVDYAHNPEGLSALCQTAAEIPAARRLLLLGQAGDRDDRQLRALVRAAWSVTVFDRVIIKEMERMLRGRSAGELPALFSAELAQLGASPDSVEIAPSEFEAVRRALRWALPGDVLVCPVHVEKEAVLSLLERMRDTGWSPGAALP